MSISEQSATETFFCALLPGYGEFGSRAEVDYNVHPPKVYRCHCAIDVYPASNIFGVSPCIIIAKTLADAFVTARCSGFKLREAEIEGSEAFLEYYGNSKKLPRFLWCDVHGQPGVDDFGLDRQIRLIVTNRVKAIIETGPSEGVLFLPGAKAPPDEELKRILFQQAELVAKRIYESRNPDKI